LGSDRNEILRRYLTSGKSTARQPLLLLTNEVCKARRLPLVGGKFADPFETMNSYAKAPLATASTLARRFWSSAKALGSYSSNSELTALCRSRHARLPENGQFYNYRSDKAP
jgi:hypothetical protein